MNSYRVTLDAEGETGPMAGIAAASPQEAAEGAAKMFAARGRHVVHPPPALPYIVKVREGLQDFEEIDGPWWFSVNVGAALVATPVRGKT